jgi:hypothetical protein
MELDIIEAATILGLDGKQPHASALVARNRQDAIGVAMTIDGLFMKGALRQEAKGSLPIPTLEAIAAAEALLG